MLHIPCVVFTRSADRPYTAEDINSTNTSGMRVVTSKPLRSKPCYNGKLVDDYWPLAKTFGTFGQDHVRADVQISEEDFQSFWDTNKL